MEYNKNFWLFNDFANDIVVTDYSAKQLWEKLESDNIYPLNSNPNIDTLFAWDKINNSHNFFFKYIDCEIDIITHLYKSKLIEHDIVLVDTAPKMPMIETSAIFFIEHWFDFALANKGMGSFVITKNYELLIEFTDDARYMLYSNFKIK